MRSLLAACALVAALGSCGGGADAPQPLEGGQPPSEPAGSGAPGAVVPAPRLSGFAPGGPISDAALGDYHVRMEVAIAGTSVGTMEFELWGDDAPVTVRNFLRLVDEGFYDGLGFHRVLREFMVQGGCPKGDGTGNSPYGPLPAELSTAPERDHRYGVLSMARMGGDPDSASCQFFICCDDGPALWNLDGEYTTFGRLTRGVATLEAIASVPVSSRRGEPSVPGVEIVITDAEAVRGPSPIGEAELRRPGRVDAAVPRVVVHSLLVACGTVPGRSPRTPEQAAARVEELLARLEGQALLELAAEVSDEPGAREDPRYAVWRLLAEGVRDREGDLEVRALSRRLQGELQDAANQMGQGEITRQDYIALSRKLQREQSEYLLEHRWRSVGELAPAVAEAAFALEVGERVVVPYDPARSPRGYTVLERVE